LAIYTIFSTDHHETMSRKDEYCGGDSRTHGLKNSRSQELRSQESEFRSSGVTRQDFRRQILASNWRLAESNSPSHGSG
jgi:hypothetical protein